MRRVGCLHHPAYDTVKSMRAPTEDDLHLAPKESAIEPISKQPGGWRFTLRALKYRNYRLYFMGQGVSQMGTWLTRIATAWLVFRLVPDDQPERAAWLLGMLGFVSLAPVFFLSPITGVLVDRWDQHRLIIITQVLSSLQVVILTILTIGGWITIWQIMVLQLIQGIINAFDSPARQAFIVQMVEHREDLPNAIAMNSSLFNGARLIGPAIGGLLIWKLGEGWCFALDSISYIAVVWAFIAMRIPKHIPQATKMNVLSELSDGVRYVARFGPMLSLLVIISVITLMGMSFQTLAPAYADALVSSRDEASRVLGLLMGAMGAGALVGAIILMNRHVVQGLEKIIAIATGLLGVSMVGFSFIPPLFASLALMIVCGFGLIVTFTSGNTLLQTLVQDQMRGRVMSFYTMAVMGTAPFGSLLAGWLASLWGIDMSVRLTGLVCLFSGILFAAYLPKWTAAAWTSPANNLSEKPLETQAALSPSAA